MTPEVTKMYIYHAKPGYEFRRFQEGYRVSLPVLDQQFDAVAVIEEKTGISDEPFAYLEFAYEKTNHINKPWWENEAVQCRKQSRSTSIGDLIVLEYSNGSEELYAVAGVGFVKCRF